MKSQIEPTMKVTFKFYNEFSMPFDSILKSVTNEQVTAQDTLVEVRQFLQESTILYFFWNFHFEKADVRINEYQDIGSNGITDAETIEVKLDEFDERSARQHVRRIQEGLNNIGTLQAVLQQRRTGDREEFPFNLNVQKTLFYEEDTTLDENQQRRSNQLELVDVLKPQVLPQFLLETENQNKKINFIQSLQFSGYNPPSPNRKLKGDLFYLVLKTTEGSEYFITSSPQGFYVNRSTRNQFLNEANTQYALHSCLLELMKEVSAGFRREIQILVEGKQIHQQPIQLLSSLRYNHQWLVRPDTEVVEQDFGRSEQWCLDLHGLDITSMRDWNEELQVFRDLPRSDFVQKINRDKALVRVHGDFTEAAVKGAIAVVDRMIQPLNPMDPELQQVYVYNHIFFSYAMETPCSFKQETGLDATPTVSTTNCDFRNLRLLHRLDIPGLHVLNASLIDYKGRRVIAQSIIPGILNSDHSNCTQYGSIDEGKTIQKTPEFHELMGKVCEYFHLDDSIDFLDGQEQVYNMAGGIEVKGILGSDKRMYLLDLLRLSPRDLNYPDNDLHQCCVLRPELAQSYYFQKALQNLKQQGQSNEESKDYISLQNSLQGILRGNSNRHKIKLNPAISTTVSMPPSEKLENQKLELQQVADYLLFQAIPALAQDLKQPDIQRHGDYSSISDIFHLHGVNMRYLGKVASLVDPCEFPSVHLCLQRTALVKSLKHVFRQAIRETSQTYLADVIAHLLNCVFARQEDKEFIDLGCAQRVSTLVQAEVIEKKKKKKKNKSILILEQPLQQKVEKLRIKSMIEKNTAQFLQETPKSIWSRMLVVATARYNFSFPESYSQYQWFKLSFFKIACLRNRELCQQIGLVLACIPYAMEEGRQAKSEGLPFQPQHIATLEPVVKCIEIVSDDYRMNMELGQKFLVEGKAQEALECYLTAAQIVVNLFGTVHRDLATCFSKISAVYYKKMEHEAAIQFQRQTVSINIHLYGLDSSITAASLTNLSFFFFGMKQQKQAFNYMLHSLYLYCIVGGDAHQEVFNQFTNLSLLYSESGQHQSALNCLFEALDRCENIHSYAGTKVSASALLKSAGYNQAIALEHSDLGDVQKAVEFQTKAVNLLRQIFDSNDYKIKESEKLLDTLIKALQEKKKINNPISNESRRAFGTNRAIVKKNDDIQNNNDEAQSTSNEREALMQKFKAAKMNAKQGFRKAQQGIDVNRLVQAQQMYQNNVQNEKNNKKE